MATVYTLHPQNPQQRSIDEIKEEQELSKQRQQEEMELMKQRQAENDQRFYTLLEEIRYLRRQNNPDNNSNNS